MFNDTISLDRLSSILNLLPAFIYIQNSDHRIEFSNQQFFRLFGEPLGRRCHEIFHQSPKPCQRCTAIRVLAEKKPIAYEWTDAAGRTFMIYHGYLWDQSAEGKVLAAGIDISDQVAARKALKESEKRYRTLYEHTPVMLHSINHLGRIVSVSDHWLSTLGYTKEEVVGKQFIDFLTEESRQYRQAVALPDLLRTGVCQDVHYELISKDGRVLDVLLSAIAENDDRGQMYRSLSVSIDVTERLKAEKALNKAHEELEHQVQKRTAALLRSSEKLKQEIEERKLTEEALRRSEKQYSTLVENSLTGIYIKQHGKIVFANERFCQIHGYSHDEIIGMDSWRLVYPSDRSKVEEYSQGRLEGMEMNYSYEARGVTKDQRVIWVVRNNTRIMHQGQAAILGNIVDITLRKRIEANLQKSENELRMLSSRLLTVQENERKRIALELHDTIAQSLVTIKFTLAQKLKQMSGDSPPPGITIESVMDMVQANITEIRRIMTDLRPSLLDDLGIIATISWHCREFQTIYNHIQVEKEVTLTEEDIPDELKIVIFRILQEAMNNIAKHSDAKKLTLFLSRHNGKLELMVKDFGKGFDYKDTLSNITDKRGLGLVGMRERAELSFGTFSIDSQIGSGTKVCVSWQVE